MASYLDIPPSRLGLRSYDITMGFRNLNENSALLIEHNQTRIAGMAAQLAGVIKGRDVIPNARKLKEIATEVLKINPFAFDSVVKELAELELVRDVRYSDGEIASFSEQVPLAYDDVHERVGVSLRNKKRSEREDQLLVAIEALAHAPMSTENLKTELGVDFATDQKLRTVAESAELIRQHALRDGTRIAVSPLYAFEQPDSLVSLFQSHATDKVREAFGRIRARPGLAVLLDGKDPIVEDMIRLGLVQAPTVVGADKRSRAFVTMPYGLHPSYLTSKKQILEKALALIACVRTGQISGGATRIRNPDRVLAALVDPNREYTLGGHSSTQRQYATLIRLGMIEAIPQGDYLAARLVVTPENQDNLEVVELARTLLRRHGEGVPERGREDEAARLLFTAEDYLAPIETIASANRKSAGLTSTEVREAWGELMLWQ